MPMGSRHDETGLLLELRGQMVLERSEGGTWRLDAPRRARRLLGQRVRVVGVRCEFDVLSVERIEQA